MLKQIYRQKFRKNAVLSAIISIYKQRMLKTYDQIAKKAFFNRNVKFGWRKSKFYPFNSAIMFKNPKIYPIIFSNLDFDISFLNNEKACDLFTLRKSHDFRRQAYNIFRKKKSSYQDIRTLLAKAEKEIDVFSAENAVLKAENSRFQAELNQHKPDKWQTIHPDFNKVFVNLPQIRSAENKRQKRLRSMDDKKQLSIDSFISKKSPSKKKTKKN